MGWGAWGGGGYRAGGQRLLGIDLPAWCLAPTAPGLAGHAQPSVTSQSVSPGTSQGFYVAPGSFLHAHPYQGSAWTRPSGQALPSGPLPCSPQHFGLWSSARSICPSLSGVTACTA